LASSGSIWASSSSAAPISDSVPGSATLSELRVERGDVEAPPRFCAEPARARSISTVRMARAA
jgi:hypothetical protein